MKHEADSILYLIGRKFNGFDGPHHHEEQRSDDPSHPHLNPPLKAKILVADLGSEDNTVSICQKAGCQVVRLPFLNNRAEARNRLIPLATSEWLLSLQPWEALTQGHQAIQRASKRCYRLPVIQGTIVSKDVRLWKRECNFQFANPFYEFLNASGEADLGAIIYSTGVSDYNEALAVIENWKQTCPLAVEPFYYQALTLLALRRYDDFLRISEHYMFLDPKPSISTIMNRYYYAMVQVQKGHVRPALQNLNLCVCARPLMAELWCLTGDIHYHLLNNFRNAKEFYENAIILGERRLQSDHWPMDVSKYEEYPQMMIDSCNKLLATKAHYLA